MTPPGLLENLLEAVHVTTAMPWWMTIVASTVAFRALMVPLNVKATRTTAVMRELQPQVQFIACVF